MSSIPPTAWTIHYRCAFDLRATKPDRLAWASVVKAARSWIREKEKSETVADQVGKGWFYDSGEFSEKTGKRRPLIATRRCIGRGSIDDPDLWALRYEHGDDRPETFRRWRTDVAVMSLGESRYRFALQVSNSLHGGFVGAEPERPMASAPRLVTKLLTSRHWTASAGVATLSASPECLKVGGGRTFSKRLADPGRKCPLLLLSSDPVTKTAKLDAKRLAWVLAGTAQVVVAEGDELDEELFYELPHALRCSKGAVRLYLPGVRLEAADADAGRHRFIKATEIDALGSATVEERLVSSLARRLPIAIGSVAWGLEDVERRERETKLELLRGQGKARSASDAELLKLYEDDNIALQLELKELKKTNEDLEDWLGQRGDELVDAEAEVRRLEFELAAARERTEAAEAGLEACRAAVQLIDSRDLVPSSVTDAIEIVSTLWPDRVVFAEGALRSAARADINGEPGALITVWQVLRSLALHLHPLLQGPDNATGGIADQYYRASGFELAWTEGKQTKKDNRLMQSRRLEYDGKVLDITPHVKWGVKPPKCLRVHFAVDERSRKIVVGHCGDHMETFGTQKRA